MADEVDDFVEVVVVLDEVVELVRNEDVDVEGVTITVEEDVVVREVGLEAGALGVSA